MYKGSLKNIGLVPYKNRQYGIIFYPDLFFLIEKRIQEKEEEFEGTRRNHNKQLEQMQFNIESESKAKAEAMRMRKKLELDIGELESALEHAHLANLELQKNIKSYQDKIRDKTMQFESEQVSKDNARETMMLGT